MLGLFRASYFSCGFVAVLHFISLLSITQINSFVLPTYTTILEVNTCILMYLIVKHTRVYIYIGGIQHAALAVAPGCDDVLFLEVNGLMVWGLVWNVRTCILYTVYNCYSKQISWIVIFFICV